MKTLRPVIGFGQQGDQLSFQSASMSWSRWDWSDARAAWPSSLAHPWPGAVEVARVSVDLRRMHTPQRSGVDVRSTRRPEKT